MIPYYYYPHCGDIWNYYFTKDYDPKNSNTGYVEGMFQAYQMAEHFVKIKILKSIMPVVEVYWKFLSESILMM